MQASGNIGFNVFSLPRRRAIACERLCLAFCSAMRVNLPAERRQKQAQTEQLKPADGQGSQKEKTTEIRCFFVPFSLQQTLKS